MPLYKVLSPLKHDAQTHMPGETISLPAEAARPLVTRGRLAPATPARRARAKPESAPNRKAKVKADAET